MADFKTHLLGAALVSGAMATGMAMVSQSEPKAVLGYFALGVAGGILPDIDANSSIPIRIAFKLLSAISAFVVVFHFAAALSLLELMLLGVGAYYLVRHGVFSVFTRFTRHRGVIHSIPAALFAGLLSALIAAEVFAASSVTAWTAGLFVCVGFLVHLILDEIYSVDLLGIRIKRSFGSALNLGTPSNPIGTALLYLGVAGLYWLAPPIDEFATAVTDPAAYQTLAERLRPSDQWFEHVWAELLATVRTAAQTVASLAP
ncbi:metal-dependent hydrolase [Thioalkalivibrio paradoxus]|uniref:Metal-dependent hydrolase n=1 Tax=Thioalkalivibrio paradoxus ARh 1 TaxID=713585 RepID=W0DPG8_9GAMM|nr:metal-dependent hydrolase [Thioalkalivibrio paradoxus]AHE99142.1 metal-dependent hydrolase [Thioalkalivibrio paradoxus ARh 1]